MPIGLLPCSGPLNERLVDDADRDAFLRYRCTLNGRPVTIGSSSASKYGLKSAGRLPDRRLACDRRIANDLERQPEPNDAPSGSVLAHATFRTPGMAITSCSMAAKNCCSDSAVADTANRARRRPSS